MFASLAGEPKPYKHHRYISNWQVYLYHHFKLLTLAPYKHYFGVARNPKCLPCKADRRVELVQSVLSEPTDNSLSLSLCLHPCLVWPHPLGCSMCSLSSTCCPCNLASSWWMFQVPKVIRQRLANSKIRSHKFEVKRFTWWSAIVLPALHNWQFIHIWISGHLEPIFTTSHMMPTK